MVMILSSLTFFKERSISTSSRFTLVFFWRELFVSPVALCDVLSSEILGPFFGQSVFGLPITSLLLNRAKNQASSDRTYSIDCDQ